MENANLESQRVEEQVSAVVVKRVAAFKGTEPVDLEPLYAVINPDALNQLFTDRHGSGRISFMYCDCEVIVEADGQVLVQGPPENSTADLQKQRDH